MENERKLAEAVEELNRVTGLALSMETVEEDAAEEVCEKLNLLAAAYRERYDRSGFLRRLLKGDVSEGDMYPLAARFRLVQRCRRQVWLIECPEGRTGDVSKLVRSIYQVRSGDFTVVMDGRHLALVKTVPERGKDQDALSLARTVVDMLNTELMLSARVGFGAASEQMEDLCISCRQARLALEIGSIFHLGETVLRYDRLGIGRLIHEVPEEAGRLFLREVFGEGSPDDLDAELIGIVNAFFENNLNISETARSLYVHRNTLVYRLEKLRAQTGLDLRLFDDAMKLKLAMMLNDSMKVRAREEGGVPGGGGG